VTALDSGGCVSRNLRGILLIIKGCSRRRFAQLKLVVYLLQARGQRFDLLLLLRELALKVLLELRDGRALFPPVVQAVCLRG
jgi:hypothetical protein